MKRVLFVVPLDDDELPRYEETLLPLGPLHLEAYCRGVASFSAINMNIMREQIAFTKSGVWKLVALKRVTDHLQFYVKHLSNVSPDPDVVSISAMFDFQLNTVQDLISVVRIRWPRAQVIIGGHMRVPQSLDVDEVFIGDGEMVLRSWLGGDERPDPEMSLNYMLYHWKPLKSIPMVLSKGCNGSCSFCTVKRRHSPVLGRSKETIVKEIEANETQRVLILDDCPFEAPGYSELLEAIADQKCYAHLFNIPFFKLTRDDVKLISRLDPQGWASLTPDASCARVYTELAGKRGDWSRLAQVVDWFHEDGMKVAVVILIGYPGETKREIAEVPQTYSSVKADSFGVRIVQPLEGSRLWRDHQDLIVKKIPEDFVDKLSCSFDTPEWTHDWIEHIARPLENDLNREASKRNACTRKDLKEEARRLGIEGDASDEVMERVVNLMKKHGPEAYKRLDSRRSESELVLR
jgi:hypothetical protein